LVMTLFWLISFFAIRFPTMANLSKFCVSVGFGCKTRGVLSGVLLDNANVLLGNGEFCDVFIGWDFFL
jgi:hypothetical protein